DLVMGEIGRRRDRGDGLALLGMARGIHADEARPLLSARLLLELYTAELRGKRGVVELDRHDVLITRDRPKGTVTALPAVVKRSLPPKASKERAPDIVLIELRIADVDFPKGRLGAGLCR